MAGNLPVPQGVELKLTWLISGQYFALNILHARNAQAGAITQSVANTIDSAVKTALTASGHAASLHTSVVLANVQTRSMVAQTDPWFTGTNAAVPGTAVGKPLPAANCLVVTLTTGQRGRSHMGRVYLAGFAEIANDTNGGATTVAATNARLFIEQINTALSTATPNLPLTVLSRFTTPPGGELQERNPPIMVNVASVIMKDQRWDVQRRRAIPGV